MVVCTQPRRLAATSVAKRVANEMDVHLGKEVGYSVRFEDMTEPGTTFLKYMTDGMLMREAMNNPTLAGYSTVIIDEAHERTIATDILMGLLKSLAKRRSDLKIIIMSATLDTSKFRSFFANSTTKEPAPLLKIPGRPYPIKTLYLSRLDQDYVKMAIRTTLRIHTKEDPGDVLVFLTGEEEIEDACRMITLKAEGLMNQSPNSVGPLVCVPLYSSLSPSEQARAFEPPPPARKRGGPPGRKVVVATNVAETSLTIDGIVYIVDSGFSKQKDFYSNTRIESLLVSSISKGAAKQRRGRAGRTRPGKCFRLYTESDYKNRADQTQPETLRTNLTGVVLVLTKLGITDHTRFHYMDPPTLGSLRRARESLNFLGILDDKHQLTALGKTVSEFPLEPQMAKMLIASPKFLCSDEVLTIVAMLSAPHVWVRPPNQQREADAAKTKFTNPDGDHLTLLNVFNKYMRSIYTVFSLDPQSNLPLQSIRQARQRMGA
ncbi:P-loop containing nucleoside triphosphate hydrolase protein [Obba rivulosa]|uniref:RNA helicase n=1 Tax=Obba rivulosa TaxID=1052685 RepID=A0A8E2DFD1_9APHY|nr:P-loop containing nucleoside triphosphate hydrolase protein [Obba rivulosa]